MTSFLEMVLLFTVSFFLRDLVGWLRRRITPTVWERALRALKSPGAATRVSDLLTGPVTGSPEPVSEWNDFEVEQPK